MGPIGDIIIAINGCFQDAAAAFLVVGVVLARMLSKKYPSSGDEALEISFAHLCKSVGQILVYSVFWIVLAGVPAAIFPNGSGLAGPRDLQNIVSAIRYAGILIISATAFFSWATLSRKIGRLKSKHNISD